jgi:2-polyprenyl-3-methyl-5-hydroxy-6-metoxy-1,4-benzoquinol methylase
MSNQGLEESNLHKYPYASSMPPHTHAYLMPYVCRTLRPIPPPARLFDLGCGNGWGASELVGLGYQVTAVDPSIEGIHIANQRFAGGRFFVASAYDDLAAEFGTFDVVVSLEVIEHLFYPRKYAATVAALLNPGGVAIISTPYHGYLKNLAISIMGKWDSHLDPLWDYGHIKLWSRRKLAELFGDVGLKEISFYRVGRIPQFAKSMIISFEKR